jgi:hypothetical protein
MARGRQSFSLSGVEADREQTPAADGKADGLASRLIESEQRLASLPELELRLARAEGESEALTVKLESAEMALASIVNSPSWRLTRPLRGLRGLLGRLRGG